MKTKVERAYHDRIAALGCVVCRNMGHGPTPANVHHIRTGAGMGQRSGHALVIPLCKMHHQDGGKGVAIHAGQQEWERLYGSELSLLNQTILESQS